MGYDLAKREKEMGQVLRTLVLKCCLQIDGVVFSVHLWFIEPPVYMTSDQRRMPPTAFTLPNLFNAYPTSVPEATPSHPPEHLRPHLQWGPRSSEFLEARPIKPVSQNASRNSELYSQPQYGFLDDQRRA